MVHKAKQKVTKVLPWYIYNRHLRSVPPWIGNGYAVPSVKTIKASGKIDSHHQTRKRAGATAPTTVFS